jgi:hypothetical protein
MLKRRLASFLSVAILALSAPTLVSAACSPAKCYQTPNGDTVCFVHTPNEGLKICTASNPCNC